MKRKKDNAASDYQPDHAQKCNSAHLLTSYFHAARRRSLKFQCNSILDRQHKFRLTRAAGSGVLLMQPLMYNQPQPTCSRPENTGAERSGADHHGAK
jgi:hypothetical protein